MNKIEIFNETKKDILELVDVRKVIDIAVKNQKLDNLEFNIIIVDNDYIHELNKNYRNIDRPTDVLSFEEYEDDYLGEIFICEEKVYEQAISYNHSNEREFAFLLTHGLLHLLGYDHIEKEDEEVMFKKQDELLNKTIYRRN